MNAWQPLLKFWSQLAQRERRLLAIAAALVLAALLWALGIAPALSSVRTAPQRLQTLDGQLQRMRAMAAEVKLLQGRPVMSRDEALRQLQTSLQQRLGTSAQISVGADRVTVNLKAASPEALAQWLSQARVSARCVVSQARLTRTAAGWDGSVVLSLPASV